MEHDGPGCVTHLYCAMILPDPREYRSSILRCYWDGAETPSVEVPLGDFFALAHARVRPFTSQLVTVNTGCGSTHGLNAYFPMPFDSSARITLENRGLAPLGGLHEAFWYHVDFETYDDALPDVVDRFHACYRQERPTTAIGDVQNVTLHGAENTTGDDNYVVLDTSGSGRMVGLVLEIDNVQGPVWYGEGDDMVFVDGDAWPPRIHGTGTEEIFGGGACPTEEYASLFSGFHLIGSRTHDGLVGMYRWLTPDPIHFARSLRWTIEHGHANNFANDYASVAYWYQTPAAALPALPAAAELEPPLEPEHDEVRARIAELMRPRREQQLASGFPHGLLEVCAAADPFYRGDAAAALRALDALS